MSIAARHSALASARRGTVTFFRQAVLENATMGAIAPTSASVARQMAALIPPRPGVTVLELGAGTGAVSSAVGPRLGSDSRHLAVDRDPALLAVLEHTAPWAERLLIDVTVLSDRLAELEVPKADVVLSTLPWSRFSREQHQLFLGQITRVMAQDGVFATLAYRPTRLIGRSRAFRAALRSSFGEVLVTSTLWANVPPARMYVCRRPQPDPEPPTTPTD